MYEFQVTVRRESRLAEVGPTLTRDMITAMRQVVQYLVAEIKTKRLSKPRTGPWSRRRQFKGRWASTGRSGGSMWSSARRRIRESGPPQYPAVLSVITGRLRQSVVGEVRKVDANTVLGIVGSDVFYGAIHELRHRRSASAFDRRWLRPALWDNVQRVVDVYTGRIQNWAKLLGVKGQWVRAGRSGGRIWEAF